MEGPRVPQAKNLCPITSETLATGLNSNNLKPNVWFAFVSHK